MFIIEYTAGYEGFCLDENVLPTLEAARDYIQAIPEGDERLPNGYDCCATIWEVGSERLSDRGAWYQVFKNYLPSGHPQWVEGYEAYLVAEKAIQAEHDRRYPRPVGSEGLGTTYLVPEPQS